MIFYQGSRVPVATAARVRVLRKQYGLTPGEWEEILRAQLFRCGMCGKKFGVSRMPNVDHRHKDGLVRGALCSPCNNALGWHHDDADFFARTAGYIDSPPACRAIGEVYVPGSVGEAIAAVMDNTA